MTVIFSGFGYELWKDEDMPFGQYIVMDAEQEMGISFNTSLEAKKWMKEHKTSQHWRADGTWDWTRKER